MATVTRKTHVGLRHGTTYGENGLLEVPRNVHTLDGFRKWVLSDEFPEKLRVTFLQGEVYLDIGDEVRLLQIPHDVHTLDGFRRWVLSEEFPEKLPVAFLQGKVYLDMSKEDIEHHALVKTAVAGVLWNLNETADFGHVFINGVLVTNRKAGVSNNPDIVAVLWESLESGRVQYAKKRVRATEVVGSPDLVVEIVSDSSIAKDTRKLRRIYHRGEIREYWVIDARGEEIVFQILHWRKAGYMTVAVNDGWLHSQVLGRSFRLTRRRDRSGMWKYSLAMK